MEIIKSCEVTWPLICPKTYAFVSARGLEIKALCHIENCSNYDRTVKTI